MNLVSLFLLLSSVFLASCAPRVGPAYIFHRDHPIEIELKDFSFRPNHFVVLKDQSPIVLLLRNTDVVRHNFTLMSPDRALILSKDLQPKESIPVGLESLNPETNYVFYCFFHQHRGMEGMLMVD